MLIEIYKATRTPLTAMSDWNTLTRARHVTSKACGVLRTVGTTRAVSAVIG